jgi:ABC-type glycerol-3-phosphate transport system substrate-binding protein
MPAPVASGWSESPGGTCTHWKAPPCHGAHPWWFADPHRAAYTRQGLLGPTIPTLWTSNSAYSQVQNEHVWQTAWAEIIQDRTTPQAAAEKAFKRVEEIFTKYPIAQT